MESRGIIKVCTLVDGTVKGTSIYFRSTLYIDDLIDFLYKYENKKVKYFRVNIFEENIGHQIPTNLPKIKLPWE